MARKKVIKEQVDEVVDETLEAADDVENQNEEELVEFQASGEASSVPDPISTGSTGRKADKKNAMPMEKLGKTGVIQKVVDAFASMTPGQAKNTYENMVSQSGNMASISAKGDAKAPMKLHSMAPIKVKEDIESLFADKEGLTEEFFEEAATLFEAALYTKATVVEEALKEQYEEQLTEQCEQIRTELSEQVSDYMDYVAEQWMQENQVAVESAIKVEMAESLIAQMKDTFAQHNIEIDDESVDVVAAYEEQASEYDSQIEEQADLIIQLNKTVEDQARFIAVSEVSKGLTLKQQDEFAELSESVDYDEYDDFVKKLEVIKESNFKTAVSESKESLDDDPVEVDPEVPEGTQSGPMAAYAQAISRTLKK